MTIYRHIHLLCLAFLLLTMTMPNTLRADLSLAGLFCDHMVLQRDMPVAVWGRDNPQTPITVSFASHEVQTAADENGVWLVRLPAMPSSFEPRTLSVTGSSVVTCDDVLVGEVWVGSGQSNMWWPVRRANEAAAEIQAADHPNLRLFTVRQVVGGRPGDDVDGTWSQCTPESAADFSAVAYYFGRDLQKALDVPVGLIHASVRGTAIEAWIPRDTLDANADVTPVPGQWKRNLAHWTLERFPDPDHDAAAYWDDMMQWYDGYMAHWTALKGEGHADPRQAMSAEYLALFDEYKRLELLLKNEMPAAFYNGMIAPLMPFTVRGVAWFQGETNALREDVTTARYAQLLTSLITSWRTHWGHDDMHFLIVGLTNFQPRKKHFKNGFPLVREAQRVVASETSNTYHINAIDLGEADNIHAGNKQDVGGRLALVALAQTYGRDVTCSGPTMASIEATASGLTVRFDHTVGELTGSAEGFEVAGSDDVWHAAQAEMRGDSVHLTCDAVAHPIMVRYAWSDNPQVNLYNQAGLPAVPFQKSLQ